MSKAAKICLEQLDKALTPFLNGDATMEDGKSMLDLAQLSGAALCEAAKGASSPPLILPETLDPQMRELLVQLQGMVYAGAEISGEGQMGTLQNHMALLIQERPEDLAAFLKGVLGLGPPDPAATSRCMAAVAEWLTRCNH